MSSFDISNVDDNGSINLDIDKSDGQFVIEMYNRTDGDEAKQRDIQLSFELDQAKEIHARLGHLIYLAEYGED